MDKSLKWKLLNTKLIFSSKWLNLEERSYQLPDGKIAEGYYHVSRPDYVLVLALNEKNQIIVEHQYRRGGDDFFLELPAGWIDEGESPETAGLRELKEETGFAGKVEWVKELYAQPGFMSMRAYVVYIKITENQEHSQKEDEFIKFDLVNLEKVVQMFKDGEIKDMGFAAALGVLSSNQ